MYLDIVYRYIKFYVSIKLIMFLYLFAFLSLFGANIVFNLTGLRVLSFMIGLIAILPIQKFYHDVPKHVDAMAERLKNHHSVI